MILVNEKSNFKYKQQLKIKEHIIKYNNDIMTFDIVLCGLTPTSTS